MKISLLVMNFLAATWFLKTASANEFNDAPLMAAVVPAPSPVAQSSSLESAATPFKCGLFGLSIFCPQSGTCGFWKRLFNIGNCRELQSQLKVACSYLSMTNLRTCQELKEFGLDLEMTTMGNTMPSEIGLLTKLTLLDLSYSFLTGTIPSTLGNLVQLKHLDLN